VKRSTASPNLLGYHAGFISRMLSLIIDVLLLAVILAISGLLLENLTNITRTIVSKLPGGNFSSTETAFFSSIFGFVIVYSVYFIFFWAFLGRTVGAIIIGIRLVDRNGNKPSFGRCVLRFLVEFGIPGMLTIGSIWIFINPRRRSIYDLISGTFVVYNWKAIGDESMPKLRWPITKDPDQGGGKTPISDDILADPITREKDL